MSQFMLKVIATDKVFYEGECSFLTIPALDGEYGIMAGHENMVIAITPGELKLQAGTEGTFIRAAVGAGFVQIQKSEVTVIVDTAERPEDIDALRASQALERAREQLRQKQSIQEYHLSKASMARALSRLKEAGGK